MKTLKYAGMIALAAMLAFSASAGLTSAYYGDYAGATVDFLNVEEHTSNPGDTVPKYGAPFVIGNTMDFNPVGFSAIAENGDSDITDGNLLFWVDSHSGLGIPKIGFSERGLYTVNGAGTDATFVDVTAAFYVDIYEVNEVALPAPIQVEAHMDFNPQSDGTHELVTDGAADGVSWSGSVMIDLSVALVENGFGTNDLATLVTVDLNNVLTAYSEEGTIATIAKKDFKTSAFSVEIIPEPASLGLLVCAASMIAYARRRFIA